MCMLFKHHVQGTFFDSNSVEMDENDGKLQNNIKLMSMERSRDELFTSGRGNISVYVIYVCV